MNFNLGLTFSGVVYIILIIIIYFKRKRIKTRENIIYSLLLITTLIELLLGLCSYIFIINIDMLPYVTRIINILYLISLDSWILFFMLYVVSISSDFKSKKLYKIFWLIYILIALLISVFPIKFYYKNNIMYTSGIAVNFTYLVAIISIMIIVVHSLINIKKLNNKKYIPMFVFLLIGGIALFVQIKFPKLFLVSPLEVLVAIVMYFTIENPDVKMLEEVHKAKEISDNANEEKTMFLYNMTGAIRDITKDIDYSANDILDETDNKKVDIEVIKTDARDIIGSTAKFTTMTNEVFDISSIDSADVKIYNNKYNIKLILKELIQMYKNKAQDKGLEFITNIASDIPEYLYGDSIGIKKVLMIILDNSIKYTNKGYIEFDVNVIITNDIARLIMTIEDSGIGMSPEEVNKAFIKKENVNNGLYDAKILITLMNGTIIPSSTYGKGTTMKIVLDQRYENEKNDLNKYESIYDKKKILLVDDNENSEKLFEKIFSSINIEMDWVRLGKEGLDKIRNKEKYDLILLDEEMEPLYGHEVMKKFREINNFNTKVILLTKTNKYEYDDEYLKEGFTDYLIKNGKKDLILDKVNKYLQ
ncbi:MAG: hybrid sensor histidine kinase/response regulator [Bacilli bacterium]